MALYRAQLDSAIALQAVLHKSSERLNSLCLVHQLYTDLGYFNSHLLATPNVTRIRRLFSEQNRFPLSLVSEAYSY